MIETLAFVTLIALGSVAVGVLVGRYYVPDDRALKRSAEHGKAYMRAVNHLLARNRDAAISELRAVVEDDVDDLEPYFALASLFRSRGEWERAIRVHQAIELRGVDDARTQLRALYELGLDFRSAGMPRRAIKAMEECLIEDASHVGALRALTGLYEQQGRFADAAEAWTRLAAVDGSHSPRLVHLLAAAAEREREAGDVAAAKQHVKEALRLDSSHPHALVVGAGIARTEGHASASRKQLLAAVRERPDLAGVVVADLVAAFRDGDGEGTPEQQAVAALSELASEKFDDSAIVLVAAELEAQLDTRAAIERLNRLGEEHRQHVPLRIRAARLALASGDDDAIKEELERLVGDGGAIADAVATRWRCSSCGASDESFYWRCPSCRHFDTMELATGEDPRPSRMRERRQFSRGRRGSLLIHADEDEARRDDGADGQSSSATRRASRWLSSHLRRKS